jgi:hypothetical protein
MRSLIVAPAGLLPSLSGLLTLRSARANLSSRLESASGPSGAYPVTGLPPVRTTRLLGRTLLTIYQIKLKDISVQAEAFV